MKKSTKYALLITFGIAIGWYTFPVFHLLVTGDFPGSAIFYGLQEDSAIVDFLLNLR